jgi:hypothetical protein
MHGKNVSLSATTCVVALQLSLTATILHTTIYIPTRGYLFILLEPRNVIKKLKSTNVSIIDEMSMMISTMLCTFEQCPK